MVCCTLESSGALSGNLSSLVNYVSTATPSTGLPDKQISQQLLGTIRLLQGRHYIDNVIMKPLYI